MGEHGAIVQMMAVDDVHLIGPERRIRSRQHDGAVFGAEGPHGIVSEGALEIVVVVVLPPDDGVIDDAVRHIDPTHHIRVDGPKPLPIYLEAAKGNNAPVSLVLDLHMLLSQLVVFALPSPIGVEDIADAAHRRQEDD